MAVWASANEGTGEGVPQDYAEAVKFLRLAAEQGIASAQTSLGVLYANARHLEQFPMF